MSEKKVLIVDDDYKIRELLRLYLEKATFTVLEAKDGIEAIRMIETCEVSIVLLDVMLPVIDGIETCRQIRKFSEVPIIMLTARTEDEDRIMGLEVGADDYVTKPFNPREVIARVQAVLRRIPLQKGTLKTENEVLFFEGLEINLTEYVVFLKGAKIKLTFKEMELLWLLASNQGKVFSRENLLKSIWGYEYFGETRTVDSHVRRLRQKLGLDNDTNKEKQWDIATVWGIGYKFEADKT